LKKKLIYNLPLIPKELYSDYSTIEELIEKKIDLKFN